LIESGLDRARRLGTTERIIDETSSPVSDEINRAVGRALREARRARGYTLKQLAARSGSSFKPSAVGGYERGERAISVERFCRLAAVYGVSAGDLLARALRMLRADVIVDLTKVESSADAAALQAAIRSDLRSDPRPASGAAPGPNPWPDAQTSGPSSRSSG
jgi:transcriptional regulator with XRE-family HTH domain